MAVEASESECDLSMEPLVSLPEFPVVPRPADVPPPPPGEQKTLKEQLPPGVPSRVAHYLLGTQRFRTPYEQLCKKQKSNRKKETQEALRWISLVYDVPVEEFYHVIDDLVGIVREKIPQCTQLTPYEALKLKDSILLADWAYQAVRNKIAQLPPLKFVKVLFLLIFFENFRKHGKNSTFAFKEISASSKKRVKSVPAFHVLPNIFPKNSKQKSSNLPLITGKMRVVTKYLLQ